MFFDESGKIDVDTQRVYGGLTFGIDTPYFEIYYHLSAYDTMEDPLFSIVFAKQHTKLYFCRNRGSDYIELADYHFVQEEVDFQACQDFADGLISESEVINKLLPAYRFAAGFVADKLLALRSI